MRRLFTRFASLTLLATSVAAAQDPATPSTKPDQALDRAIAKGELRAQQGAQAQARVDQVYDQIRSATDEYKGVQKQIEGLKVYMDQLRAQLGNQNAELAQIKTSIDNVTVLDRQIVPLLLRMIDAMDQLVALDAPFLKKERVARVERLRATLPRSDVSVAEKFRNVMAAYSIEVNYGNTIEAYRGALEDQREVDMLRVGRVALLYRTLDGKERAVWNKASGKWVQLDQGEDSYVLKAIRIAREQTAPDLIHLPIATAEVVQ
ncbi:MAG: DUF3450 domain-containing protein [Panacagrimonas sp.]